jgi:hypothetical protein
VKAEPGYSYPPGRQVYPVTANHIPFHMRDSLEPLHEVESESFFWSPDSRYVAFADYSAGAESIVLVRVGDGDLTTYTHVLKRDELCQDGTETGQNPLVARVDKVEFVAAAGAWDVWVYFSHIPCPAPARQPLRLHMEHFQPAPIEVHKRMGTSKK